MNPKKRFGYIGIMFAIHSLLSVTAHGQTAWTLRNPYPTPHRMSAVTWTGSLLVAVGDAGVILTSPDGSNWTNRNSGVA